MTRILDFTGPRAPKRFALCWLALMAGGDGKGERTREIIRKEARLQDAFEAISTNGEAPSNGLPVRILAADFALPLPQEDFELLDTYVEKAAWTPQASRDVVDLWDWLSASEKKD